MDRLKPAIMGSVLNNPTVPKQVFLQNNNPTVAKPVLLQKYPVNIQTRSGHTVNLPVKLRTVHFRSS